MFRKNPYSTNSAASQRIKRQLHPSNFAPLIIMVALLSIFAVFKTYSWINKPEPGDEPPSASLLQQNTTPEITDPALTPTVDTTVPAADTTTDATQFIVPPAPSDTDYYGTQDSEPAFENTAPIDQAPL